MLLGRLLAAARPLRTVVSRHGVMSLSFAPKFVVMNDGFSQVVGQPAATQWRSGGWEHGGDREGAGGSFQQGRLLSLSLAALGSSIVMRQNAALCEDGPKEVKDTSMADASVTASAGALVESGTTLDLQAVTNWVKKMVDQVLDFLKGLYATVLPKLESLLSSLVSSTNWNALPNPAAGGEAVKKKPDEETNSDAKKDAVYEGATQ